MISFLKKKFILLKNSRLSKCLIGFFSYSLKLEIKILNTVVDNIFLYSLYISFLIYCYFGCTIDSECNWSHLVVFILVANLMGASSELYFLCKVPKTKELIIKLVGKQYFIDNFPTGAQLVLKYYLPIVFLFILELLTTYLTQSFYSNLHEYIFVNYQEIYGFDPTVWSQEIKEFYRQEQSTIIITSYKQGIVSYLAQTMNFIVASISKFFKICA